MPEMRMEIAWPDGRVESCYSPSLVLHDHLSPGAKYPLGEFLDRAATALTEASARVRARYGMECTSARQQLAELRASAARYPADEARPVRVLSMEPPLPREAS